MLRTSRCFAALFFKSGGPDALPAVAQFLDLHSTDFSTASIESLFPATFFASHKSRCLPIVLPVTKRLRSKSRVTAMLSAVMT
jgi:hypothetical protein